MAANWLRTRRSGVRISQGAPSLFVGNAQCRHLASEVASSDAGAGAGLFGLPDDLVLPRPVREQKFIDLIGLVCVLPVGNQLRLVVAERQQLANSQRGLE